MFKKILSLENLILATVFFLPVYLIKLNFIGIPSNMLEIFILLVLAIWIFKKDKKFEPILKENKAIFISAGVIFLGLIISAILNPNLRSELGIIKGWLVFPFIFAFIVRNILGRENKEKVFIAYYYSALAMASIALVYYFLGEMTYDGRLKAFFNSPNYLMMYLAPGLIIGVCSYKNGNLKNSLYYVSSLVIVGLAIYLTRSYAGWLSLFLAFLISGLLIYRKKAGIFLSLSGLFLLLILIFQFQTVKFNDLASANERSSLSSRVMIWKSTVKILEENWLWGIGSGNFQEKYLENQKYFPPYLEWAVPHPHNLYLNFWLSGGLLGLIGFLMLIVFWIRSFWKDKDRKEKVLIFGMMLYVLIHGVFDTTYFKNDLAVVFWLIIFFGIEGRGNKSISLSDKSSRHND